MSDDNPGASLAEARLPLPEPGRDPLLTDKQAPEIIGVKRKTLQEWRRSGKGPEFIRVSNRILCVLSARLRSLAKSGGR